MRRRDLLATAIEGVAMPCVAGAEDTRLPRAGLHGHAGAR